MKQNGRDKSMKSFFVSLGMFFITPFLAGFASYLYGGSIEEFLRNVVVSVIGIGSILFAMSQSKNYDEYLWDNKEHY